ncbi:MAG: carbohydrate binding family 9 domain-containing protein [Opitutae bacterium]|nr:carbohydrate binding family 9 domain-containing protein [Opitutae bacterium]
MSLLPRLCPARLLPGVFAALIPLAATAKDDAPRIEARAAATPPKIDGVISPGEWDGAAHSDAFRQVFPRENSEPTERTEFWVTYDADNIYVAVRNHDSAGLAGLRAYSMQRDQDNGSDDLVRIVFDTFHRENDGYYFALTAAGGKHDGLIQNKTEPNDQWDALWIGKVSRDAGGWSAEFAIPLKTLSFDPANDTWGFNVARAVRRKQEAVRWSGFFRNKNTLSLPDLGELRGLHGLKQGRGIDLKPFASLTRHSAPETDEHRYDFKPGLDLVWHVTPSLAATLTLNTDFADAEVDERKVNLGRFSLFFPEKRGFFTQDASLFAFGGLQQDNLPFFSRRIGLAEDGTKVDVLGGAKLTGRAGPWTIGVLDTQIDRHAGINGKNLLVGRIARQVLDESSAGLIFTHGEPRLNGSASLVGADFNYVNSHIAGTKVLNIHAAVQATDTDQAGGRGTATTVIVDYPNEPINFNLLLSRIDAKFDPALGFSSRTGIREHHPVLVYRRFPDWHGLRRIDAFAENVLITQLDGRRLDNIFYPGVELESIRGDTLTIFAEDHLERLDNPFAIRSGIVIPARDYHWSVAHVQFRSTPSRPVTAYLEWREGGFFGGNRSDYEAELGWRPSHHLELATSYKLYDIRLPQGDFAVRLASLKAVYTVTPDLQFSVLGQYDNFSNRLGVNFRVKWIVEPGNEVFFVVNQGYDTTGDHLIPTQNDTSLKAAWTFRF